MAKDRFTVELACPECGKKGEARCVQEDGWAFMRGAQDTSVTSVTDGFTRVKKPSWYGDDINFTCDDCGALSVAKG